jgi:hypothetical protein
MKNITILGKRWFDKKYGNTYFTARILVDNKLIKTIPMQYGYGDQYEWESIKFLKDNGIIEPELARYEIREKYNLVSEVIDVLKRELDSEV